MSFTGMMQTFAFPACCWVKGGFQFKRTADGKPAMDYMKLAQMPDDHRKQFEEIVSFGGHAQLTNLYALNKLCTEGVFLLKMDDFERFEETDITINVEDYSQPFPTVVVQLPKAYSIAKTCDDPYAGTTTLMSGVTHEETHRPDFVILSHDVENKVICGVIYLTSKDIYSMILPENGMSIEKQLTEELDKYKFAKSLNVTAEELVTYSQVFRAALNACLLADFGITKPEPENPSYYLKLVKRSKTNHSPTNRRLLALHPKVFSLLYKFETGPRSPHWRRAHWRMQRYGPGLTLQKRIRISRTWIGGGDDRPDEPSNRPTGELNSHCEVGSLVPDPVRDNA